MSKPAKLRSYHLTFFALNYTFFRLNATRSNQQVVLMQGNSLMRILHIAAFAVSGYASTEGRQCKPFNPLLGETYEADYPDKGLRFFSEKVAGFSPFTSGEMFHILHMFLLSQISFVLQIQPRGFSIVYKLVS